GFDSAARAGLGLACVVGRGLIGAALGARPRATRLRTRVLLSAACSLDRVMGSEGPLPDRFRSAARFARRSKLDGYQPDCLLGAGADAETAGVTGSLAHGECLAAAVEEELRAADEGETSTLLGQQAPHLEDVVGADPDAVFLGLAPVPVDDGDDSTGFRCAALLRRGVRHLLRGALLGRLAAVEAAELEPARAAANPGLRARGDGAGAAGA